MNTVLVEIRPFVSWALGFSFSRELVDAIVSVLRKRVSTSSVPTLCEKKGGDLAIGVI